MTSKLLFAFGGVLAFSQITMADSYTCKVFPQVGSIGAVNNAGTFAGTAGNQGYFEDETGKVTYVSYPGSTATSVGGINNSGDVDGAYTDAGGVNHLFIRLASGTYSTVSTTPDVAWDHVGGINDARDIAVSSEQMAWVLDSSGALVYAQGNNMYMPQVGNLNNSLQAIYADTNTWYSRSFVISSSGYTSLGQLDGDRNKYIQLSGLNNNGDVTGGWYPLPYVGYDTQGPTFSFVQKANTHTYSVPTCDQYGLISPAAINDLDWIAGTVSLPAGPFTVIAKPGNKQPTILLSNTDWTFAPVLGAGFGHQAAPPWGPVGETGTVYIANTGHAPLYIPNLACYPMYGEYYPACDTSDGPYGQTFQVFQTTCTGAVNPGNFCSVTFQRQLDAGTGQILLYDNTPDAPHYITLHASSLVYGLTSQNSTVSFGTRKVGVATNAAPSYMTTSGGLPITFTSVAISGTNAGDFAISSNTCVGVVQGFKTCQTGVVFTPGAVGLRTATLTYQDNADSSPQMTTLTGAGK